jgi:hypothetical protein
LCAAAAFYLRTAGIALLVTWVLEPALQRRWRAAPRRVPFALACVLAWQGYVAWVRGSAEYAEPAYAYQRAPYQYYNVSYAENLALRDPFQPEAGGLAPLALAERAAENAVTFSMALGEVVSAPRGYWRWPWFVLREGLGETLLAWAGSVPPLVLTLAIALGFRVWMQSGERAIALYVAASLGLILPLPWPVQIPRYLAPLAPFLAIALVLGWRAAAARRPRVAGLALACVLSLELFATRQVFAHNHLAYPYPRARARDVALEARSFFFEDARVWRAFYASLEWLSENAPADARIASSCPQLVHLLTGRQAVMPPFEDDVDQAQQLLDGVPVDYLVADRFTFLDVSTRYMSAVVADETRWEPVHRVPELLTIYRRRR